MKEIRIALDELDLTALVHGPEDAPPLLALHGWLDNAASFASLAEYLPGRRLIALDMPGHGHSDHLPPTPFPHYNFVDSVPVVLAAATALGLERFDLLGHSMGAGIGSLVAAAAPARVRRLALIEGLGPLADDPGNSLSRFRAAVTRPRDARRLRVFPDIEAAVQARHRASGLPPAMARPIIERGLRQVADGYSWRSDPRLTDATPVRLAEDQVHRLITGISCPTLLLLAKPATPYLPTAAIEARAARLADIRVERIEGRHHLHLEHPAEVGGRVQVFLDRADVAAVSP